MIQLRYGGSNLSSLTAEASGEVGTMSCSGEGKRAMWSVRSAEQCSTVERVNAMFFSRLQILVRKACFYCMGVIYILISCLDL
jgi:hypothetical protein